MGLFRWSEQAPPEESEVRRPRRGERLERDLRNYLLASLLAFLGLLPYLLGITFAVSTHSVFPLLLSGILGGMFAATTLCGLVDTVLRSLRDDIGLWWLQYRTAWKRNAKAALLPGAAFGLILAVQIFSMTHVDLMEYPGIQLLTLCLTMVLLLGIGTYLFPMLVLLELPFPALLKNSLLLFLQHFPKSIAAALILFAFVIIMLLWFPVSTVALLVGCFWIPVFLSCRIVYPILDTHFDLTAAFEALNK